MDRLTLRSVQCPQCAGPLEAGQGRVVVCGHCGVRILVRQSGGFSRWYFPAKTSRLQAVGAASGWLKRQPEITKGARAGRVVEATLLYAPIWEYKAFVTGWETGSKMRTKAVMVEEEEDQPRFDLETVREDVIESHLNERRYYQEATDLSAVGATTRPLVTGRELALPLLPGELEKGALQLEAYGNPAEVLSTGRKSALAVTGADVVYSSRLFALREGITLFYYPLWLLRFKDGDRLYEVTVDGRSGDIFSARAPAANGIRVLRTAGEMAVLAAIVAGFAHLNVFNLGRISTLAVIVIVSLAVLYMAWQLEQREEVEYHDPYSR